MPLFEWMESIDYHCLFRVHSGMLLAVAEEYRT